MAVYVKRRTWALFLVYATSNRKNAGRATAFVDVYRIKKDAQDAIRKIKALKKMGATDWGDFIGYEIKELDALWGRLEYYQKKGDRETLRSIAECGHDRNVAKLERAARERENLRQYGVRTDAEVFLKSMMETYR